MNKILLIIFIFYQTVFAQFGGTRTVDDEQTLPDKFHVYKISKGQRVKVSQSTIDSLIIKEKLILPSVNGDVCDANSLGEIILYPVNNTMQYCNGSSWIVLVYDNDGDGLSSAIDGNDNATFSAGTAGTGQVVSGYTFYTGSGLTYSSGSMANNTSFNVNATTYNIGIPAGYHDSNNGLNGTSNFSASNIKSGVNLFGTTGTFASCVPPNPYGIVVGNTICGAQGGLFNGYSIQHDSNGWENIFAMQSAPPGYSSVIMPYLDLHTYNNPSHPPFQSPFQTLCTSSESRPTCTGLFYHAKWQQGSAGGGALWCESTENTGTTGWGATCDYTSLTTGVLYTGYPKPNSTCSWCHWYYR